MKPYVTKGCHREADERKGREILASKSQVVLHACVKEDGMACPAISKYKRDEATGIVQFDCNDARAPATPQLIRGCPRRTKPGDRKAEGLPDELD